MIGSAARDSRRLVVRADADSAMGVGHVMRMIALGQAWRERGGDVAFLSFLNGSGLAERIRDEGFSVHDLDSTGVENEVAALMSITSPGDWVVLDGYHFDTTYQNAVMATKRQVLVVDDVNDRGCYRATALLNQNGGAEDIFKYEVNADARMLLGSRYTLLRKEFRQVGQSEESSELRNLLVTMGGGDADNVTSRVLSALDGCIDGLCVKVLAGPAFVYQQALREQVATMSADVVMVDTATDMAGLMRWADAAVTAAGSTCWELCALGVPMIALAVADNQSVVIDALRTSGAGICMSGDAVGEELPAGLVQLRDSRLREGMREAGQRLIDGHGAYRVTEAMCPTRVRLRPVEEADSSLELEWANDVESRSMSFKQGEITESGHEIWFKEKLSSPDTMFFMGENQFGVPVGVIRFDHRHQEALISVNLAPPFRRLGLGSEFIKAGTQQCRKEWGIPVVALIKTENRASEGAFQRAGYRFVGLEDMGETQAVRMEVGGDT